MKNALWYIAISALSFILYIILAAVIVIAVLPIVAALTLHGFRWFGLWILEPVLIAAYVWLNNMIEDL